MDPFDPRLRAEQDEPQVHRRFTQPRTAGYPQWEQVAKALQYDVAAPIDSAESVAKALQYDVAAPIDAAESVAKALQYVIVESIPPFWPRQPAHRIIASWPDELLVRPAYQFRPAPPPPPGVTPYPAKIDRRALWGLYADDGPILPPIWPPRPPGPPPVAAPAFGHVLPIDPRFLTVDRWTAETGWNLAPFGTVPALRLGMQWQTWARYVNSLPGISAVTPPSPDVFDTWEAWAAAFNEKVVYARYRI